MYIFHMDALAHPAEEFIHRLPRRNGLLLWRNLYEAAIGRMGVVLTEDIKGELLETWLRVHNIRPQVYEVIDPQMGDVADQIETMMALNGARAGDMYVDVDPARTAGLLARGTPTLLLGDPFVLRKEWTIEYEKQPPRPSWDSLVEEMDRQAVLRSKKEWQEE